MKIYPNKLPKLRNNDNYIIGLDLGTSSVGWAAIDVNGDLCQFKNKPTWGSRLFNEASKASEARTYRGQRRRYIRRKWRLNFFKDFFKEEIDKVDPEFFSRLDASYRIAEERDFHHPLFNESLTAEVEYYKKFPTIYHLRKHLIESDEKADIRLIYLALHNIIKYRGNFLRQGEHLSSANSDIKKELTSFVDAFDSFLQENWGLEFKCNLNLFIQILTEDSIVIDNHKIACKNPSEKAKALQEYCFLQSKEIKQLVTNISRAIVGLSADFSKIFELSESAKFSFKDDEKVDNFVCPDNYQELFESLKNLYSAYVLQGLLSSGKGSISFCKVADYEKYGKQLSLLKKLFKKYRPEKYNEFFRGEFYEGTNVYDASKAKGYTRYNLGISKLGSGGKGQMTLDELSKEIRKHLDDTPAINDKEYLEVCDMLKAGSFLVRQKTSDNGSIPYQLHLEELQAIIDKQSSYYPFLSANKDKIETLVTFRIPYYVGPMSDYCAPTAKIKGKIQNRFSWSVRNEGKEDVRITPWNWSEVINKNESAQIFIDRMTGTCTYLPNEDVLPRCSLLYEEFCVRNELNGSWHDDHRRFDKHLIELVYDELFKKGTVTKKKILDLAKQEGLIGFEKIGGFQGENKYESRLSSYIFFTKDIFGIDELPEEYYSDIEDIILWNTVYEDRAILKERLCNEFCAGQREFDLSEPQIDKICKKRFTGWGKLSRKLLTEIKDPTYNMSVIDILRYGISVGGQDNRFKPLIFQEIITNEDIGIKQQIEQIASDEIKLLTINELPGSPAIRRSINQAIKIVAEIEKIAKHPPKAVFIEVTRDDNIKEKGKRKDSRLKKLEDALKTLGKTTEHDTSMSLNELSKINNSEITEKLMLYMMQNGKCMYSGEPLDINNLDLYQVDHIIPQFFVKDDSFDNKVLVLPRENQRKSDLSLDYSVVRKMSAFWEALHNCSEDLVSSKKLRNLKNNKFGDRRLIGFINRQLVETSQINKNLRYMLQAKYDIQGKDARVYNIKASLSSELRSKKFGIDLPKCRDANDYHHAHDAYLAAQMGRFLQFRHCDILEEPVKLAYGLKKYIENNKNDKRKLYYLCNGAPFLVYSFKQNGFDLETGEIEKDTWNAEKEITRIKGSMNMPYCYISRMPVQDTGAFWDETIYSPKQSKKKLDIKTKNDRKTENYGGFSRGQSAYFTLVRDYSNQKKPLVFLPIPINIAISIEQGNMTLMSYVQSRIDSNKLFIIRSKIYKFQLIEVSGDRYYITGNREVRNSKQIAFTLQEYKTLLEYDNYTIKDLIDLFNVLNSKLQCLSNWLYNSIAIDTNKLTQLSKEDIVSLILGLCMVIGGKRNTVDTHLVGGSKYAGTLQKPLANLLSCDACFVDQSTTGMFEKKTKIEV